jgi:translation initiation factor eIF-2B subunit gamma
VSLLIVPGVAVLNHPSDPLAAALAKSTVASLSLTNESPDDHPDYFESTNPTSPSSPNKTPGETLVDFKYSLSGKGHDHHKRKSYQRPAPGDELRCAMVIYERPTPEIVPVVSTQNQKGRNQQAPEKEKDVEPPLMRGNTVAGYWELCRQVSCHRFCTVSSSHISIQQFLRAMPPNFANLPARQQPGGAPSSASAPTTPAGVDAKPAIVGNVDPKAQVSADTLLAPSTRVGERTSIKKCIIGRHCILGKNVKLTNCVVWDYVVIADG